MAVDMIVHLLAVLVTLANEQKRAQTGELAKQVQTATQRSVRSVYMDQGYNGEKHAAHAGRLRTRPRQEGGRLHGGNPTPLEVRPDGRIRSDREQTDQPGSEVFVS